MLVLYFYRHNFTVHISNYEVGFLVFTWWGRCCNIVFAWFESLLPLRYSTWHTRGSIGRTVSECLTAFQLFTWKCVLHSVANLIPLLNNQAKQYHQRRRFGYHKLLLQKARATTDLKPKTMVFWYLGFLPGFSLVFCFLPHPFHKPTPRFLVIFDFSLVFKNQASTWVSWICLLLEWGPNVSSILFSSYNVVYKAKRHSNQRDK